MTCTLDMLGLRTEYWNVQPATTPQQDQNQLNTSAEVERLTVAGAAIVSALVNGENGALEVRVSPHDAPDRVLGRRCVSSQPSQTASVGSMEHGIAPAGRRTSKQPSSAPVGAMP